MVFQNLVNSAVTISIFIEVGGDVDSVNNEGDTAFHILATNMNPYPGLSSIKLLYEAGVHLDQTNNAEGKTMVGILRGRRKNLNSPNTPVFCNLRRLNVSALASFARFLVYY